MDWLPTRFAFERQGDPRSIWAFAPETMVRLMEADYFLHRMVESYREPYIFSFNLHAEMQAVRNITLQMQKELDGVDGFAPWYEAKRAEMRGNTPLRNLKDARVEVAHRNTLRKASHMHAALVRDGKLNPMPLEDGYFLDPFDLTEPALRMVKETISGLTGMDPGSFEVGLKREWIVSDVSGREIVGECHVALDHFGRMVADLARHFGFEFAWQPQALRPPSSFQVAFSGPVDPALADRWDEVPPTPPSAA